MILTVKVNYLPYFIMQVGLCVGGSQRRKREGALNYLCITEVLFKVSLFSYFFLNFSLYFHSFLFFIFF